MARLSISTKIFSEIGIFTELLTKSNRVFDKTTCFSTNKYDFKKEYILSKTGDSFVITYKKSVNLYNYLSMYFGVVTINFFFGA